MSLLRNLVRGQTDDDLIAKIDAVLNSYEGEERPGWHPSALSWGFCPKQLVLASIDSGMIGVDRKAKKPSPVLQRVFDTGHSFHDRVQSYVRETGLVVRHEQLGNPKRDYLCEEVSLKHPCGLTGRADHLLLMGGSLMVVDYKSTNQRYFDALFKPMDKHVRQVWLYLGMLEHAIPEDLSAFPLQGLLLYENKNDSAMRQFKVPWNQEGRQYFDEMVFLLEKMNRAIEKRDPDGIYCNCGKH